MKERGIIFNSEMIRAILDGRKTQTRRIVKHQRHPSQEIKLCDDGFFHWSMIGAEKPLSAINYEYGRVGDRLWVRETFALLGNEDGVCVDWDGNILKANEEQAARIYRASCEQKDGDYGLWSIPDAADWKPHTDNHKFEGAWTPSIHMPRWASRITLEITDVRVEHLQDISEEDALTEGITAGRYGNEDNWQKGFYLPDSNQPYQTAKAAFCALWQSIYGVDSFYKNPWVWVIEFKRV
ncbi:hypothetical protein [Providencia sp. JUb39]|uniref:hypothetical protein n=1 Tax=Providencia sp. JUb39 TaxID=2724165 RepID=UPI001C9CCF77|nr:hypothetical protein [Providencia sp. JUb39]